MHFHFSIEWRTSLTACWNRIEILMRGKNAAMSCTPKLTDVLIKAEIMVHHSGYTSKIKKDNIIFFWLKF